MLVSLIMSNNMYSKTYSHSGYMQNHESFPYILIKSNETQNFSPE